MKESHPGQLYARLGSWGSIIAIHSGFAFWLLTHYLCGIGQTKFLELQFPQVKWEFLHWLVRYLLQGFNEIMEVNHSRDTSDPVSGSYCPHSCLSPFGWLPFHCPGLGALCLPAAAILEEHPLSLFKNAGRPNASSRPLSPRAESSISRIYLSLPIRHRPANLLD